MANEERSNFGSSDSIAESSSSPGETEAFLDTTTESNQQLLSNVWLSRYFAISSLLLWLISLALPGFDLGPGPDHIFYGGKILAMGVLLGWLVGIFSAYANIFYAYAMISILRGKLPLKSLIAMVMLAATTCTVRGLSFDGGVPPTPIVAWGWGVVVWGVALCLLVLASLCRSTKIAKIHIALFLSVILAIVFCFIAQYKNQLSVANEYERTSYLFSGMAFSTVDLCNVPITQVTGSLIPEGEPVSLDDSLADFMKNGPKGLEPILERYEKDGFVWGRIASHRDYDIGKVETQKPRYTLKAVQENGDYILQLVATDTGIKIYEQRIRKNPGYSQEQYCPISEGAMGYIATIRKAAGQEKRKRYFTGEQYSEEANEACDDQHPLIFRGAKSDATMICSPHYVARVTLRAILTSKTWYTYEIELIDRNTLSLIDEYVGQVECPSEGCATMPSLKGVIVAGAHVQLHTSKGIYSSKPSHPGRTQ